MFDDNEDAEDKMSDALVEGCGGIILAIVVVVAVIAWVVWVSFK